MLDEKLNALIRKYGIYDSIGGGVEQTNTKGLWNRLWRLFRRVEGEIRLVRALNSALDLVEETDNVAIWLGNRIHFRERILLRMLSPKNQRKIRFQIRDKKGVDAYRGWTVLDPSEIEQASIKAIISLEWESGRYATLLSRNFSGKIIDMNILISENHLGRLFVNKLRQHPYTDIFIARHLREQGEDREQKQLWHKRLIAHYIRARDFLTTKEEIIGYIKAGYEDASNYINFWAEMEKIFSYIRFQMKNRKQRDVFVYWLDQMEKEDFYSMKWIGNTSNGIIFHNAYTTMVYTTAVLRSIFTGKKVKDGKLMDLQKLELKDTVFSEYPGLKREIHAFSGIFNEKLGKSILHRYAKYVAHNIPSTIWMWNSLDLLLNSSVPCVILLHCLETHAYFICSESPRWNEDIDISLNNSIDFSLDATLARDYLDRELKWYNEFLPRNSVSIYMSDHGSETDLSEQNVNMPFKIQGRGIISGNEMRIFSYKDMHKLIDWCSDPIKRDISTVFSDYAIIDVIDPYEKSYGEGIRENGNCHYVYQRKKYDKTFLKKYIQTTKVVTAEGEYYTINILGEETYYRDKECKNNLIGEPIYAARIAELREKAGKFYNPWKEKRQVAIDFYEYLGIEEKDILAQCY